MISKVLDTVRGDKAERALSPEEEAGVTLSQTELERLFGSGAVQMPVPPAAGGDRAAKIAERQARAAAVLAQANASSPRRLSVVYGSILCTGAELAAYKAGSVLELDRASGAPAEILVDGKPFGRGVIGSKDGKTAVRLVEVFP